MFYTKKKVARLHGNVQRLLQASPEIPFADDDRIVIFSDVHMGNGSRKDDFRKNSDLFTAVLANHYLPRGYRLILNGDIEELHRFRLHQITSHWGHLYELFRAFHGRGRLTKIAGNHDGELLTTGDPVVDRDILESLLLTRGDEALFIYHGHQASSFFTRYNALSGFFLRYAATPLGIQNYSVSRDSRRRFATERTVYSFSAERKIVSIIGHTHRPLFQSLSKIDYLKFDIERMCRRYPEAVGAEREELEARIRSHKVEIHRLYENDRDGETRNSLYNSQLLVPCLFNSGCVIGKSGITAIEIHGGNISLVHWFDGLHRRTYLDTDEYAVTQLGESSYYRVVLKEDELRYVFTRIRLLT